MHTEVCTSKIQDIMFSTGFAMKQFRRQEKKKGGNKGRGRERKKIDEATVLLNLGDRYFRVCCTSLPNL